MPFYSLRQSTMVFMYPQAMANQSSDPSYYPEVQRFSKSIFLFQDKHLQNIRMQNN